MTTKVETTGPGPHPALPQAACRACGGVKWWTSRQHPGRAGWRCITCCAPLSVQVGLLDIRHVTPRAIEPAAIGETDG